MSTVGFMGGQREGSSSFYKLIAKINNKNKKEGPKGSWDGLWICSLGSWRIGGRWEPCPWWAVGASSSTLHGEGAPWLRSPTRGAGAAQPRAAGGEDGPSFPCPTYWSSDLPKELCVSSGDWTGGATLPGRHQSTTGLWRRFVQVQEHDRVEEMLRGLILLCPPRKILHLGLADLPPCKAAPKGVPQTSESGSCNRYHSFKRQQIAAYLMYFK